MPALLFTENTRSDSGTKYIYAIGQHIDSGAFYVGAFNAVNPVCSGTFPPHPSFSLDSRLRPAPIRGDGLLSDVKKAFPLHSRSISLVQEPSLIPPASVMG